MELNWYGIYSTSAVVWNVGGTSFIVTNVENNFLSFGLIFSFNFDLQNVRWLQISVVDWYEEAADLFQCLTFGFRQEEVDEDDTRNATGRVEPKSSVLAERYAHFRESANDNESACHTEWWW